MNAASESQMMSMLYLHLRIHHDLTQAEAKEDVDLFKKVAEAIEAGKMTPEFVEASILGLIQ